MQTSKTEIEDCEKVEHLKYLINSLLPFLQQICEEQNREMEIEANIQGISLSSLVGILILKFRALLTENCFIRDFIF